ncbi:MAG TPA: flagellar biosynthetic protein FliQ [Persephonella sp.]|uniref:Flagellar biosynthetic protein FliQ n=1 Tax=Persephonella marina (strain DSM 14350 / EX-H1) TaxID=123214 RepID=C0QPA0_PERMH|nr:MULTISPECIES: flagellar biosynthesis protein FliQ [Persephonella]ACO03652.1 flagellar biosynthetic protein FliQ [Persephonella marina EX-H1]HCB69889.1 flagellar biosynthetic protein FliQ [Persephonella sp.]
MTVDQAINLMQGMLFTSLMVGGPVILIAFIVGLLISIFQAATQIHEMTLTFIPKIVATIVALIIFGSWMFRQLVEYTQEVLKNIIVLIS